MFFTPKPVPKRVSGGVVCLMLVMLGGALFAGFDLMGSVESQGPDKVRATNSDSRGPDKIRATNSDSRGPEPGGVERATNVPGTADALNVADVFVAAGQAALRALTAVVTKIVTAWWPTGLLDWMQAVHRVWAPIHRLPGTSPPQP
jgi:hypothetical protein